MASLKKYCKFKANSLVESVIALCIISICLYIAILVFAAVFTARTSITFYNQQQKVTEIFFIKELGQDTINEKEFTVDEEIIKLNLKKITIQSTASQLPDTQKSFYIQNE